MKPRIFCGSILICCWLPASAETNSATTLSFALPTAQLRTISPKEEAPVEKVAQESQPERTLLILDVPRRTNLLHIASADFEPVAAEKFSVSVRGSALEMEVYRRLEEGGYLTRPEPETPLEHFLDRSFSPEVIHIGRHATASCTLYTAIVRKNPLCLLNPMFLFISW